jgi:hypothetical protein
MFTVLMREDAANRTTAPRAPGPCNVQRQAVVAHLQAARLRGLCEGVDGRNRTRRELFLSHLSWDGSATQRRKHIL